jgi:hypothetical protein
MTTMPKPSQTVFVSNVRAADNGSILRDLDQMHFHDAAIEIGEGPEPPAREKPVQ